jgi:hypothetical protein
MKVKFLLQKKLQNRVSNCKTLNLRYNLILLPVLLFLIPALTFAEAFYSPSWGFSMDLPEGYDYTDGDGKDRFSFSGPNELTFDIIVYNGTYKSIKALVDDVNRRLGNKGSVDFFDYHGGQAAVIELILGNSSGWGLCVTLAGAGSAGVVTPMLLALSYNASENDMNLFHLSALDSISPTVKERVYPGPITEYSYPRGEKKRLPLAVSGLSAMIRENDAEAAQVLIEREFNLLVNYIDSPYWKEAWLRYYRFIYRDSFDRIADAVSVIVNSWGRPSSSGSMEKRAFARKALVFVQGFKYERNLEGSDFLNLVTAVTEGRGDCDARAMLWAIILSKADIRAAMMVSRQHSHAMGLADIDGSGARFEAYGTKWLVAETTADVDIGLIAQDISGIESWLGIVFE